MIDIARCPVSFGALKDIVKTFSFYKINEVHFHLNDNRHSGATTGREDYNNWKNYKGMFRLESKTFPSLKTDPQQNAYYNDENGAYGGEPRIQQKNIKISSSLRGLQPESDFGNRCAGTFVVI